MNTYTLSCYCPSSHVPCLSNKNGIWLIKQVQQYYGSENDVTCARWAYAAAR